jgi:hypothetical protein
MIGGGNRRFHAVGIAAAAAGAVLVAWAVHTVGTQAVREGMRRLGAGFLVVAALGGVRGVLRIVAWRLCLDDAGRLPFWDAFRSYWAGGALGNITPFGILISEPSKIVLVRKQIGAAASIPALAVENLFYTVSVALMLGAGTAGLLLAVPLPAAATRASAALLVIVAAGAIGGAWIVLTRRRLGTAVARRLGLRVDRVGRVEDQIFGFTERHPERVLPVVLCQAGFHAAAVFEFWFALTLFTGQPPSLLTAFVLEYVNRAITIAFQFVPLWLGVDEAGTGFIAAALGLNPAAGVSLALARKGRIALWTAIGLVLWWPTTRAWSNAQSPAPAAPRRSRPRPAPAATVFPSPRLSERSTAE